MQINKHTAFRGYSLKSGEKAVCFNTKSRQYTFLDGLSAELFKLLYSGNQKDISAWCKKNEISDNEVKAFCEQLIELGIFLGEDIDCNYEYDSFASNDDSEKDSAALNSLMEELHENGLFYSFHIDLTNRCNEKCIHCYHPFDEYDYSTELTFDEIKELIDTAYDSGVFSVVLSGGEALLRNDFFDIVDYISEKGLLITLFTNGVLLTEENVSLLSNYRINVVSISIYGDTADIHDPITTVNGSFDKTLNGIEQLKKYNIAFDLKCVVMRENASRIKQVRNLCKQLNFGRECTLDFTLCGKLNGDCSVYDHKISIETLRDIFYSDVDYFIGQKENFQRSPDSRSCGAGRHGLYCSADGKIYPCVSFRLFLCDYKDLKNINNCKALNDWQNTKISDFRGCFEHNYCKYCVEQCAGNNLIENNDYLNGETTHCDRAKIIAGWFEDDNRRERQEVGK